MKVFYDFEFIDDGKTIDPISLGMVTEQGDEYYAVFNSFDRIKFLKNQWLIDNVLPSLPFKTSTIPAITIHGLHDFRLDLQLDPSHKDKHAVKSKSVIAQEVSDFLKDAAPTHGVELWAWYASYDNVALAQLFGPKVDTPDHIPMYTNDLRQVVTRLEKTNTVRIPRQMGPRHNALADAWQNLVLYRYLKEQYKIPE